MLATLNVLSSLPPMTAEKWQPTLIIGILLMAMHGGESMVHFQTDDIGHSSSGLTLKSNLPELSTFSFCVRLYSYRSRYSDYFFSYATEDQDNELAFHLKYDLKELRMACCNKRIFHIVNLDIAQLKWTSFCVAVNLTSTLVTVVHTYGFERGILQDAQEESNKPLVVEGDGIVILGQDQDEPGGGTDKGQSFNGYMADLILTTDILSNNEMQAYINCDNGPVSQHPTLIDFNNILNDFKLGYSTKEVNASDYCETSKLYSIFTEARNFKEAKQFCSILNGRLALPMDNKDNEALYSVATQTADVCTDFDKANGMWVAAIWNMNLLKWMNVFTQTELSYTNFEVDIKPVSVNPLCVIAETLSFDPRKTHEDNWAIESCARSICTACEFENPKPLKIRGLCAETIFDRHYYVYDRINSRPVFNGKSWSKIAWNNSMSAYDYTWVLYQIAEPSVQARMIAKSELDYPIGVHEFEVIGDKCPGKVIKIKLTSCTNGMYTCNDGSCIPITMRCNLELDCTDHSDELNCGTLVLPLGYERRLPPPKTNADSPALIDIDCNLRLIRKFSLLDSNLVLDILITRSWFDSRVQFKNLHENSNLNLIDDLVSMIWYPDVTLLGSDYSIANTELLSTSGWGKKMDERLPDDEQLLDEDVFYSGIGNRLVLDREISVTLMCTFDLTLYPFDSQRCPLIFYVGEYTQHYVSTVLNSVKFSGTRRLLEYQVTRIDHEPILYQNKSGQQITLLMTNLYGYYISGAYVPTMLLIIISYLTFFFALDDFTNRVMVSLTSLLVLAALFSQIASGLPKTAYMKLIDVWFIFCIMSDFIMVVTLVAINVIIDKQTSPSKIKFIMSSSLKQKVPEMSRWNKLDPLYFNRVAQTAMPVFMGLFIFLYFSCVAFFMAKTGT